MGKKIRITSKIDGFRRGGIAHPSEPTDHDTSKFTKAQLQAIENEPRLVVQEVEDTAKPPSADELVAEIKASDDKARLAELAKDSRKSVASAAAARLKQLDGNGDGNGADSGDGK